MSKVQLTDEQKKIVEHFGTPLMVLAGPGTGKTLCIIEKIKRLVSVHNIPVKQICAMTFTTAAAGELRSRLENNGFKPSSLPYVNTLHGLAMGILRKHLKRVGLKKNFRPTDNLTSKILVKDISQDLKSKGARFRITEIREYLYAYCQMKAGAGLPDIFKTDKEKANTLKKIEYSYCDNLEFYNAVDWQDILHKAIDLIDCCQDIQTEVHEKTPFLLVDEYQDLSPLEQRFVRVICGDINGLCVVGDDDQSIYETFRFADPQGIIDFCKMFPSAKALYITKCRRCPPKVIEYALKVIKNNKRRVHSKILEPFDPSKKGFAVIFDKKSKKAEIEWVVNKVLECMKRGYSPGDIMVLFTDGKVALDYIIKLREKNIPLNIQLKVSHIFKEDYFLWLLATLRWLVSKNDNLSMRQCLDYWEGVGSETVYQLRFLAISLNLSLYEAIEKVAQNTSSFKQIRQRKRVQSFFQYLQELQSIKKFSEIAEHFFEYVPLSKDAKGCQILYKYLKDYDDVDMITLNDLLSDFEQKLESGDLEAQCEKNEEGGRVMSMHSAKGCESPIVFMPALEDDLIPGMANNIEEKRRLFYVSLTRTIVGVFLTWARQRTGQEIHIVDGRRMLDKKRSRFLDEILVN